MFLSVKFIEKWSGNDRELLHTCSLLSRRLPKWHFACPPAMNAGTSWPPFSPAPGAVRVWDLDRSRS